MNILRRIFYVFFGKKAHSKNSHGKLYKGMYYVRKGSVGKGDMLFYHNHGTAKKHRELIENCLK